MKLRPGVPEEVRVSSSAVERIRERCSRWVTDGIHPALVVVAARKGVIFLQEAFGKLTPERDSPDLPLDAIFGLASLTKPITSTCAMILVEEGLLGMNRAVREYIPEFVGEGKERVMVHHLLTHSAGLAHDDEIWKDVESLGVDLTEIAGLEESEHPAVHYYLQFGLRTPLAYQPGEWMEYSSYGIYLLGEIVRRVSGISLDSFATQRIFGPLGMRDTRYVVPEELQSRVVLRSEDDPNASFNAIEIQERPSPSGGAYSTAMDMAVFGQTFLNRGRYGDVRILSPVTVSAMTRNRLPGVKAKYFEEVFPEASWGLGWSVNADYKGEVYGEQLLSPASYGHGGAGGIVLWIDPVHELLFVFFSVLTQTLEHRPLLGADLFMNMVAAAVEDQPN